MMVIVSILLRHVYGCFVITRHNKTFEFCFQNDKSSGNIQVVGGDDLRNIKGKVIREIQILRTKND